MLLKRLLFSLLVIIILVSTYIYYNAYNSDSKYINESLINYEINGTYNELICKNILIIEKIDLKKCMNINDVDKDIAILYDDKTVVLASHSGNASNAYFKNLYKVQIGDEVTFYHNSTKNIYYVTNIKTKKKKDKLQFENIENQLILITCSYDKKDEQIVYFLQK